MREMHGPQRVTMTGVGRDPAAPGTPDSGGRPWSLMVLLSVAQFMVILDATVVNVALPSIARSLGLAPGDLQWVVTAYVLASGTCMCV
jgi:predicted MFS family arabinose efflux permease